MHPAVHVFRKEIIEGARDRRALVPALFFGPLLGPVLFAVVVSTVVRQVDGMAEVLTVPVVGAEHAPNLVGNLAQRLIDVDGQRFEDAATLRDAVRRGEEKVGLVIDEQFGAALHSGSPARLWIIADESNASAQMPRQRLRGALADYGATIGSQRLLIRGIDPQLASPFAVAIDDVSTPSSRSVLLLGAMTLFLIFAMLVGGAQVAIDAIVGERERGSLEPLLTLPVPRRDLVLGKVATAAVFMAVSLALAIMTFAVAIRIMPLAETGMTGNLSLLACLGIFGIVVPFTVLGAGVMTFVASFTKTLREAQAYTSIAMAALPLPLLATLLSPPQSSAALMMIPSLSQHLLVAGVIKGQGVDPAHLLLSATCTIAIGVLCMWGAIRRFRSERLLV